MEPVITQIEFIPIHRNGSNVGFVNFLYDNNLAFKGVAVHQRLDKSGYRLNYTEKTYPINRETQKLIEHEISSYLLAQGLLK